MVECSEEQSLSFLTSDWAFADNPTQSLDDHDKMTKPSWLQNRDKRIEGLKVCDWSNLLKSLISLVDALTSLDLKHSQPLVKTTDAHKESGKVKTFIVDLERFSWR